VTGPSSAPRGERAGTPGAGWETELRSAGERFVPDGEPEPRANRAARRAAARARKRSDGRGAGWGGPSGAQEAREGPSVPVSGRNSPQSPPSRLVPENASENRIPALPPRTEPR